MASSSVEQPVHPLPACATHELIRMIGDRWSVLVLIELGDHGPTRSSAIKRAVDGVSQKVLTTCLRRLEDYGLIYRTVEATSPVSVTYGLTAVGQSFFAAFSGLREWADKNAAELETHSSAARRQAGEPNQAVTQ